MRIIGFMVCGAGEADKFLEKSLNDFKRLCDQAVICLNNTDKKTEALIRKYGYWSYRDDREWGIHQPSIKTDLLKRIERLRPDWIIAMDADEQFDEKFTREEAEELTKQGEIAYHFYIVDLWNDEEHYLKALGFWNIRFYKFRSDLGMDFQKKRLHCGLAPPYAYSHGWNAPYFVKNYGLMRKQDRQEKIKRYAKYDPRAIWKDKSYYDILKFEGNPNIFNPEELRMKLSSIQDTKPRPVKPKLNIMNEKKYVYVRRLEDGRVLDIPVSNGSWISVGGKGFNLAVSKDLSGSGFEFVGEIQLNERKNIQDIPIIEEEPVKETPDDVSVKEPEVQEDSLQCPLCGFVGKSKVSLNGHKRFKHEGVRSPGRPKKT